MNAAEDNDVRGSPGRLARQAERITNEVGDILDFGTLGVVGEDDRVSLLRQRFDAITQVFCGHGGHD